MNFTAIDAVLTNLFIHQVGNKSADEQYTLSKNRIELDDELSALLAHYFFTPFKSEEFYRFYHDTDLQLNEVFTYAAAIFDDPESLYEQSVNLAKHLYNQSVHPKIKGGEFGVAYFKNCNVDGQTCDAVGIFKSENKDTFFEIERITDGFEIESRKGIHINKLDKGCLIFNTDKANGYVVAVVDHTNKGIEAQYWKDDFLGIQVLSTDFYKTNQFLGITKQFVTQRLTEDFEVSKADQIDFLNRSVDYFKTRENFDKQEFETEVFGDGNVIESFRRFDENYRQGHEIELADTFDISPQAVKKQARVFKSVLKLDKNFHIYIHGNRELIEQGIDENGRKYYKIYYNEES